MFVHLLKDDMTLHFHGRTAAAACVRRYKKKELSSAHPPVFLVPSTFEDKVHIIDYSTRKAFKRIRKQNCTFSTRNENVNRNKDDSRQIHSGQTENKEKKKEHLIQNKYPDFK